MYHAQSRVAACRDREEDVMYQQFVAVATGRDRTLAEFPPVLQHLPTLRPKIAPNKAKNGPESQLGTVVVELYRGGQLTVRTKNSPGSSLAGIPAAPF